MCRIHPTRSAHRRPGHQGMLFGIIGFFPATPPIVTLTVIVQMLYVHDVLGDDIHVMGLRE